MSDRWPKWSLERAQLIVDVCGPFLDTNTLRINSVLNGEELPGVEGHELLNTVGIEITHSDRAKWDKLCTIIGSNIACKESSGWRGLRCYEFFTVMQIPITRSLDGNFSRGACLLDYVLSRPYPFTDISIAAKHARLLSELFAEFDQWPSDPRYMNRL